MNKREFIKVLEDRLNILEESELKDIINEYRDTIDEKVKHGKTEKEAVNDFGSIDELVKEILQAYKINPKYADNRTKNSTKEIVDDFESFVKKGAKSLADWSRDIYEEFKTNNQPLTIELIFEILIKAIILLVIFALLRLPFVFITYLGNSILDMAIFPLNNIFIFVWSFLVWCLYVIVCVLVSIAMFKRVIKFGDDISDVDTKGNDKKIKKNIIEEKEKKKILKNEEKGSDNLLVRGKTEKMMDNECSSNGFGSIVSGIFKVFIVIFCLIPTWFLNLAVFTLLIISIYYVCIGISLLGLVIFFIGFLVATLYLSKIFYNIAFNRKKVHYMPFVVSLIFIVIGSLLTLEMATRIEYVDSVPDVSFSKTVEKFEFKLDSDEKINTSFWSYGYNIYNNSEKIINNDLEDGEIIVEVLYYDKFVDLIQVEKRKSQSESDFSELDVYSRLDYNSNNFFAIYNLIVDNLKNDKVYNYNNLLSIEIVVYCNDNTYKLIK